MNKFLRFQSEKKLSGISAAPISINRPRADKNIISENYGLSERSFVSLSKKNGSSQKYPNATSNHDNMANTKLAAISTNKNNNSIANLISQNSFLFNRFLRLKQSKIIDAIKKQSSWKGLRIRQGLPLNYQRTHTNSRTAKKLNSKGGGLVPTSMASQS